MTSSSRFTVHGLNGIRVFLDHNRSAELQCRAYNKTDKIVQLLLLTSLYLAAHSLKYRESLGLRISLTKLSSRNGEVRFQKSPLLYLQMEMHVGVSDQGHELPNE